MKKNYLLLFLLGLLLWSCRKNEVNNNTCSRSILHTTAGIAFKGFEKADLDGAWVDEYEANTHYTQLLHSAALNAAATKFVGEIAYAFSMYKYGTRGFFYLEEGKDYKITIGTPAKEFLITDISGAGPSSESWTQTEQCAPESIQPKRVSYTLKLNGTAYTPIEERGEDVDGYYIYLAR